MTEQRAKKITEKFPALEEQLAQQRSLNEEFWKGHFKIVEDHKAEIAELKDATKLKFLWVSSFDVA